MKSEIELVLFDLGGVLVELRGIDQLMAWSRLDFPSIESFWEQWTLSQAVSNFEIGLLDEEAFVPQIIAELEFDASHVDFLQNYRSWVGGYYPGVLPWFVELSGRVKLACLSNTNPIHWEMLENETEINNMFDAKFLSHQIGYHKPDPRAFEFVLEKSNLDPARILYLDDSSLNVAAAQKMGFVAFQTVGLDEAKMICNRELGFVL